MKISIVAPNLNEARFLPVFLGSLARQTFRNFEVIIVDGGSTDGSTAIMLRYMLNRNLRIQVLVDQTRNIGYIRNVGSMRAQGDVVFNTSTDTYFPPDLLARVATIFAARRDVVAVSGRTFPLKSGLLALIAYCGFDIARALFTLAPFPLHKFRPAGNFSAVRNDVLRAIDYFPEVKINEDGLLGQKIDAYVHKYGGRTVYNLGLYVGHHAKRFQIKGGLKSIGMYFYVFSNMLPWLKPLLKHIESRSAEVFATRKDIAKAVGS